MRYVSIATSFEETVVYSFYAIETLIAAASPPLLR